MKGERSDVVKVSSSVSKEIGVAWQGQDRVNQKGGREGRARGKGLFNESKVAAVSFRLGGYAAREMS